MKCIFFNPSYEDQLSKENKLDAMKAAEAEARAKKAFRKARNEAKRLEKDLGRPKRPLNAYALFFKEKYDSLSQPGLKVTEVSPRCKELWNSIGDLEREDYVKRAGDLKAKYEADLAAWERKMEAADKMEEINKAEEKLKKAKQRQKKAKPSANE